MTSVSFATLAAKNKCHMDITSRTPAASFGDRDREARLAQGDSAISVDLEQFGSQRLPVSFAFV